MKQTILILLAGLLTLSAALTSCQKDNAPSSAAGADANQSLTDIFSDSVYAGEPVTRTTHLTGIFRDEPLPSYDNITYRRTYSPTCDENGNLTIFTYSMADVEKQYAMLTLSPDGDVLNRIAVDYDRGYNIDLITTANNTVYYTQEIGFGKHRLFAQGEHGTEEPVDLTGIFSQTDPYGFNIEQITADASGNIYLRTSAEAAVFSPDLILQFILRPEGGITAMNTDIGGTVQLAAGTAGSYGLYPVDTAAKALGTPHLLGKLRIDNLFFADGYDFYYTDNSSAVYGVNYPTEEEIEPSVSVVMNYLNSGVESTSFTLLNVLNAETLLAAKVNHVGNQEIAPVLYKKAPDRDLSEITVIEVAYTDADYYFEADVMNFNKKHDDIMIILQDYSRFGSESEPEAGKNRLAMDVVTGVYQPDILLGTYDHPFVKAAVDQGTFVNLRPYIESDEEVNPDNLFPGILYSYSTVDEKIWGLPLCFEINTIAANNAVTGGLTSWNFTEMMKFADTLPTGVSLMQGLTRGNAMQKLLGGNAYAAFIDVEKGTCDFTTDEFTQFLEFMKSLPEEARPVPEEEEYLARHNGESALYHHSISGTTDWLSMEAIFNSEDFTIIGFPTEERIGKGSQLVCSESYTILSASEHPDAAWEFIRFMLGDKSVYNHDSYGFARGIPVMRNRLEKMNEKETRTVYEFRFNMHGHSAQTFNSGIIPEELPPMRDPAARVIPTQSDLDAYLEFLANGIGERIVSRIPDELNGIVNEEISAYLNGAQDASSCAAIIESRVNLWLAEHS